MDADVGCTFYDRDIAQHDSARRYAEQDRLDRLRDRDSREGRPASPVKPFVPGAPYVPPPITGPPVVVSPVLPEVSPSLVVSTPAPAPTPVKDTPAPLASPSHSTQAEDSDAESQGVRDSPEADPDSAEDSSSISFADRIAIIREMWAGQQQITATAPSVRLLVYRTAGSLGGESSAHEEEQGHSTHGCWEVSPQGGLQGDILQESRVSASLLQSLGTWKSRPGRWWPSPASRTG